MAKRLGWFKKQPPSWGLESATALALELLKPIRPPNLPFAWETYINQTRQQGSVGVHDRWIVTLIETAPGVVVASMPDIAERRNQTLRQEVHSPIELAAALSAWHDQIYWWSGRLTVNRLQPQKSYRVLQGFTDFHGGLFEAGQIMRFTGQHFVPYHGGYTLMFQPAPVYLQENQHQEILTNFDLYFEEAP